MNEHAMTEQLGISWAIVWALEQLKRWPAFRWVAADTDRANRLASTGLALLAALGMSVHLSGTFQGGGTLTITWRSLDQVWGAGTRFLAQLAMQELVYRGAVKKAGALQAPATGPGPGAEPAR